MNKQSLICSHCEIQAKTVTGSLDIEGALAPVTGRVITGQLRLKDIQGPIYAKTVAGKLRGVLGNGLGEIKVKVTTGNLLIQPITEKTAQPVLELV